MSAGALAYALNGGIYVAEWDGSNSVKIAHCSRPRCVEGRLPHRGTLRPRRLPRRGTDLVARRRYLAYRHTDCEAARDAWWDVVICELRGR